LTAKSTGPVLDRALDLVRFLRANCSWDAQQTPDSLVPYLLEEAHEVADAIALRHEPELARELGDLLLNVAFQTVLAEERGAFTTEDVVNALETKMRRRHPHLYGDGPAQDWERLKAQERMGRDSDASLLDGIPRSLDPLSRAQRIQDRVSAVGFDWRDPAGALAKVREELTELEALPWPRPEPAPPGSTVVARTTAAGESPAASLPSAREATDALEEELGDLLFSVVNASRLLGVHAMTALRKANDKFSRRFRALEALARARGLELAAMSLESMDALWDEVKRGERDDVAPPPAAMP
jgi:uncharacterized protein YabN with tetrapyrrole methylase and pyrophosphatase domain